MKKILGIQTQPDYSGAWIEDLYAERGFQCVLFANEVPGTMGRMSRCIVSDLRGKVSYHTAMASDFFWNRKHVPTVPERMKAIDDQVREIESMVDTFEIPYKVDDFDGCFLLDTGVAKIALAEDKEYANLASNRSTCDVRVHIWSLALSVMSDECNIYQSLEDMLFKNPDNKAVIEYITEVQD